MSPFVASMCILAVAVNAGAQDRSTPESTVRSFLAAFEHADVAQAAMCVRGVSLSPGAMQALAQQIRKDPATLTVSGTKRSQYANTAFVSAQVTARYPRRRTAEVWTTQVHLEKEPAGWVIIPDAARARNAGKPDMVNGLAYMLTNPAILGTARDSAKATACLSNVKQLCLGLLMLAQDHDSAFVVQPATLTKSLQPYVKNTALFQCPAERTGASYSLNPGIVGVNLASIRGPSQTVLIYEGRGGKPAFRHDGKAAIGFADGHAKMVDAAGARSLRWKP